MTTDKQIKANQQNSLKGGVKTQQGKDIIKNNAITHGLSSRVYDEVLEETLIGEYDISGTLEKILIKNICISKARYEKGIELEHRLYKSIIKPTKYEKIYNSKKEYEEYLIKEKEFGEFLESNLCGPIEPPYTMRIVEGDEFDYDFESIQYLTDTIGKYNFQNEVRLTKNIETLLSIVK